MVYEHSLVHNTIDEAFCLDVNNRKEHNHEKTEKSTIMKNRKECKDI